MMIRQRLFIEAAMRAVGDAKAVLLPALALEEPTAPWTAETLARLSAARADVSSEIAAAIDVLQDCELPLLREEERLVAEGVTLASNMAAFDTAMGSFEHAFWEARWAEYQRDPDRWPLRLPTQPDVCREHRLDAHTVRHAIRRVAAESFDDVARHVGANPTCPTCRVGVTRLLVQEVKRRKEAGG
jgi:bacterioferritin-associated ferredoxin